MVDLQAELLALIQAMRSECQVPGPWLAEYDEGEGFWVRRRDGETAPELGVFQRPSEAEVVRDALNGGQARFEAELARRLATAIRTAIAKTVLIPTPVPYAWEQPIYEAALAAAREASHAD